MLAQIGLPDLGDFLQKAIGSLLYGIKRLEATLVANWCYIKNKTLTELWPLLDTNRLRMVIIVFGVSVALQILAILLASMSSICFIECLCFDSRSITALTVQTRKSLFFHLHALGKKHGSLFLKDMTGSITFYSHFFFVINLFAYLIAKY